MIFGGEKQSSQGDTTKWILKMLPYFEKGNYINHDSSYLGELVLDMILNFFSWKNSKQFITRYEK